MRSRITFELGNIEFGQFQVEDTLAMYEIRNHPTVRTFMPTADILPFEKHEKWVNTNLVQPNETSPLVMIGRVADKPIGFGLLKPTSEPDVLEVGVIVAGEWQRKATSPRLGVAMFAIASHIFGARILVSNVHRQHEHALRLNKGAGLIETGLSEKPGEIHFRSPVSDLLSTAIYRRCIRGLRIRIVSGRNEVE